MVSVLEINQKNIDLCIELDSCSIKLWTKKQWQSEIKKKGVKVLALFLSSKIIGVTVFQVVVDEAHIHYFSIHPEFRKNGYGSFLMNNAIDRCQNLGLKKILLEVSESNLIAENFYANFNFLTVGRRRNYYKDGSDAVLKEKKLIK